MTQPYSIRQFPDGTWAWWMFMERAHVAKNNEEAIATAEREYDKRIYAFQAEQIVLSKSNGKKYFITGYDPDEAVWLLAEIKVGVSIESLKDSLACDVEATNPNMVKYFIRIENA